MITTGMQPTDVSDWRCGSTQQHIQQSKLFGMESAGTGHTTTQQGKDYTYQEGCSLIINYLPPSVTSDELRSIFSSAGYVHSCKVMLDPKTKVSKGFGFVNFSRPSEAEEAIRRFSGMSLYNKTLKVSFARPSSEAIKNTNVYVCGIPLHYTQMQLERLFSAHGKILTSTILRDSSGASRGQALVRFNMKAEAEQAIETLNDSVPDGCVEPITVRFAIAPATKINQSNGNSVYMPSSLNHPSTPTMSNNIPMNQQGSCGPIRGGIRNSSMRFSPMEKCAPGGVMSQNQPPSVSQLYVYPLASDADDIDLYRLFSPYGAIQSARVIKNNSGQSKGFGFVNMLNYQEANLAMQSVNGLPIKGSAISVSFKLPKKN